MVRITGAFVPLLFVIAAIISFPTPGVALDAPAVVVGQPGHSKIPVALAAGASGMPYGFTVWWMDAATFDSHGRQWPAAVEPGMGFASFTGKPTLNTFGGVYDTFRLGAHQNITVEIGDLADETGVEGTLGELRYDELYYLCVFANDASGNPGSPLSSTLAVRTTNPRNCTFSQGYWKNHEGLWPATHLRLGSVVYTKQQLLSILNESVRGNGLVSLAHQLIATKLNIANGADPTSIREFVDHADALIGDLVVPPVGGGYLRPNQTSSLTQAPDDFNNGRKGPGHCGSVPVEESTWGNIKALFQ